MPVLHEEDGRMPVYVILLKYLQGGDQAFARHYSLLFSVSGALCGVWLHLALNDSAMT